ncbi:MAG: hypothetical protein J5449_05135, partial [Oscillospiraceae bacterium]|nr:hypothetical protein [Oscillospiraceae bacterium]
GLVGVAHCTIKNCVNTAEAQAQNYVGGIAGECTGVISGCENRGAVTCMNGNEGCAGGITGYTWTKEGIGHTCSIENCTNNGPVKAAQYAAGISAWTEAGRIINCVNNGKIEASISYPGGIASASGVDIINCVNNGTVVGSGARDILAMEEFCEYKLKLNLMSNNGTNGCIQCFYFSNNPTVPECKFSNNASVFCSWNTAADGTGTQYMPGGALPEARELTLYASWLSCRYPDDPDTAGTETNPWLVRDGVFNLTSGWYAVDDDVTMSERMKVTGDVKLILSEGKTLNSTNTSALGGTNAGINVSAGNKLTVYGPGSMELWGRNKAAAIGGSAEDGVNCGTVIIMGGTITAEGAYGAAGIGGGKGGKGGRVEIYGGTITAKGNSGGAGIGGGEHGDGGVTIVYGGSVYARAINDKGNAAAGIGSGRPSESVLNPGSFYFHGGVVKAVAGKAGSSGTGAEAIGTNLSITDQGANSSIPVTERISLEYDACVKAGEDKDSAQYADPGSAPYNREKYCQLRYAVISICENHKLTDGKCKYCGGLAYNNNEDGSADRPYIVSSTGMWKKLCTFVESGFDTSGKYFEMNKDLAVATMLGSSQHPFCGHFDGKGFTMTVNLSARGICAPFGCINGAEIRHLKVQGSVTGGMHSAGLVGVAAGTNLIEDCAIDTTVTATGTHCGGVVGHGGTSSTTLRGVLFSGSIKGQATTAGTFWGWSDSGGSGPALIDCLDDSGSTFPIGLGQPQPSRVYNTLYLDAGKTAGADRVWDESNRGKPARNVMVDYQLNCDFGEYTNYETSGIKAYKNHGMTYKGNLYVGAGDTAVITFSPDNSRLPWGQVFGSVTWNSGTLTKVAGEINHFNLTPADSYVLITPVVHYLVTVNNGTGGGYYSAGSQVQISPNEPAAGKEFDKWTTDDGVSISYAGNNISVFTMPEKVVTVTANYKDVSTSVSGDLSGGRLKATVTTSGSGLLVAVAYENGRQTGMWTKSVNANSAAQTYTTTLEVKQGCTYKVMLVKKTSFVPLCAVWRGNA